MKIPIFYYSHNPSDKNFKNIKIEDLYHCVGFKNEVTIYEAISYNRSASKGSGIS